MKISIVDYGIGNILSVRRALEYVGAEVEQANTGSGIKQARALVLPGVGAFADGMKGLRERGLLQPVKEYAAEGGLLLGICLGMQMLLDESEEFGRNEGLGLIAGEVRAIPRTTVEGSLHKIPHVGWNALKKPELQSNEGWQNTILEGIQEDAEVYFVHSFTAVPVSTEHRLADALYGGRLLSAVIRKGNIYGCQFHPEKSGPVGLKILSNYVKLARKWSK